MSHALQMNQRTLSEILPQRYPFLLVDRLIQVESRKFVVGLKNVSLNEPYFQGHFPDHPVMPGVLILESLSQTGAALFLNDPEYMGRYSFFASMNNVEFHREVVPGDQLRLEMEVKSIKDTVITMMGRALVEGDCVCSGTFSFNLSKRPSKPQIDGTASVHHTATLGKNVTIGPNTIIGEHVHIGDNTIVEANCFIEKWTRVGEDCHIHFGGVIGSPPQDMKYKGEKSWVVIGDRNEFREYVTINRPTGEGTVTEIGSDNTFLIQVHIAHNCVLGNNIIIANTTGLGGHTTVEDRVVIGGMTGIHQFVRIGKGAMVGAYTRLAQDMLPFMLCEGNPALIRGVNLVGLRRNQASKTTIKEIKDIYKALYRSEQNTSDALEFVLKQDFSSDDALHLIDFLKTDSNRGFVKRKNNEKSETL